jgi:hypothetical protein
MRDSNPNPPYKFRGVTLVTTIVLALLPGVAPAQCATHLATNPNNGNAMLGWPSGSTIKVYFETGQPGDLTTGQQAQFMSGLQYWTQAGSNYANLTFVNAGVGNPQGAVNTSYVTVSGTMESNNSAAEEPTVSTNNTTLSDVLTLNASYVNGSLPLNGTQQFHNS